MSKEYDNYLTQHIANVKNGYEWIKKFLPELLENVRDIKELDKQIRNHDKSKWSDEEYDAYDKYFYGKKDKEAFDLAWKHHQNANTHHWQYWLLINDEDGVKALEIPYTVVIEMICDWWSFSWAKNDLYEIFDWYKKQEINLHKDTRKTVEMILDKIKEKLDEQYAEVNS